MTRFNPFPKVDGYRGSPMGRRDGDVRIDPGYPIRLSAKHQGGGEGYDRGGAYWGLPSDVWAVWETGKPDTVKYVRAKSREDAFAALRL